MVKKYKVVKTKRFDRQLNKLNKNEKKAIEKAIGELSLNPKGANTMSVFGEPSPKELRNWASELEVSEIDIVLEYLNDKKLLNDKGKEFATSFWKTYIKEKK